MTTTPELKPALRSLRWVIPAQSDDHRPDGAVCGCTAVRFGAEC